MERTTLEHHFRPKLEVSNSDPSSPFGSFRDPEQHNRLMPSPSASSKFVLSVLKFLGILKFLSYTQNILGVLK